VTQCIDPPVSGTAAATDCRVVDLDFVIVGGGILGTAVAAVASQADYRVLLLRMTDRGRPRADTLRNQGWLQSGVLYPMGIFKDEAEYRVLGTMTYFGGREMLARCGMEPSNERAVVRVRDPARVREFEAKAKLLRLRSEIFRRLDSADAQASLGALFERGSAYFLCPDCPFDEAAVLTHFRGEAVQNGAQFLEIDEPVKLLRHGDHIAICWAGMTLDSPVTLITAGAGGLELLRQIECVVPAEIRQTPLLVHPNSCGVPVPILVDFERQFSLVKHSCTPADALVIGTKVHQQPVSFIAPEQRRVSKADAASFRRFLHPHLEQSMQTGRFTAGFEVMPTKAAGVTHLEPFVKTFDNVVFASPGRATLALQAAEKVFSATRAIVDARGRRRFEFVSKTSRAWCDPIDMHYQPTYQFNDAEA
jgi:glycine/D-amino acid oxidase-like deaminating enzyme